MLLQIFELKHINIITLPSTPDVQNYRAKSNIGMKSCIMIIDKHSTSCSKTDHIIEVKKANDTLMCSNSDS